VGFFWGTYYPLKRYRGAESLPEGEYGAQDLDVEAFLPDYERLYAMYEEAGGETLWTGAAFWGVPWMEALCGCRVVADHATGSSRSLPLEDLETAERLPRFDPHSPWVGKAVEFLQALRRQSAGRYPLGTTLMRGISDILAALHGSPQFIYKLYDAPAQQRSIIERIVGAWIGFGRSQLEAIPDFHGGTGSCFYGLWMPGRGTWVQEDASALLSPPLFEEFILPGLNAVLEKFDTAVIHLHPSSYIPVDLLVDTRLAAIELHIDYGGPRAEDLLPAYRQIQAKKPLVIWGDLTAEDLDCIAGKLDRRSLALVPVVQNREEAEGIWRRFKR